MIKNFRHMMLRVCVLVIALVTPGLLAQDTDLSLPESERPLVRCRRPMCMMFCELGFQTDSTGCPVCKCLENPCTQPESDLLMLPEVCPPNTHCEHKSCTKHPCTKLPVQCLPERGTNPPVACPMPMCANQCPSGYSLDKRGCMSCRCKQPSCENHECGEGQRCQLHMELCDEDLCDMVPTCVKDNGVLPAKKADCPVLSCEFEIVCEYGYQKDESGCPICDCTADPCDDHECVEGAVCETRLQECEEGNCPLIPACKAAPLCHMAQDMWDMMKDMPMGGMMGPGSEEGMEDFMEGMMGGRMGGDMPHMGGMMGGMSHMPGLMDHPMFDPRHRHEFDRPMCDDDSGHFMPRQCDRMGVCWCVDDRGIEVPGTRTPGHIECNHNRTVSLDMNMKMHHDGIDVQQHMEEMQKLMRERMSHLMMVEEQWITVVEISPQSDTDVPHVLLLHIVVIHDGQTDLPSAATLFQRQLQAGQREVPFHDKTLILHPETVHIQHHFEVQPPELPDQPLRQRPVIEVDPIEPKPVSCWRRVNSYYRGHKMPIIIAVTGAMVLLLLTVSICMLVKKRRMASYQFRHQRFDNMDNFRKNLVMSTENELAPDGLHGEKGKVLPAPEVCVTPELEQKVTLA